ncbi:MAG: glutathione S-transferase N-terminal domain-containing protein [Solirubrobacterales bacterium]
MNATLFTIPGSHPGHTARLMCEAKGLEVKRVDLIPVVSKPALRAAGFDAVTVPAVKLDGERIQGSREIARELDRRFPDPPLYPDDPDRRAKVEEAERWGDEVLQPVPRRVIWNMMGQDRSIGESYLRGAKLGIPVGLAAKTSAPLIYLAKRFNDAHDEAVKADIAALPGMVDRVDELIAEGVLGGERLNAADYQIAPSLRLLMTTDDLRPTIAGRPAGELAMRVLPDFPGYAPRILPRDWLEPIPTI